MTVVSLASTHAGTPVSSHGFRPTPGPPADRRLAITIDDLPWVMLRDRAPADLAGHHARLLAALRQANVPVVGFVNEGQLYQGETLRPERVQMLRDWLDAGFELGNHTRWHSDLHAIGVDAYQADILAGEQLLRPLLAERGQAPRWFRHPYLHTGRSLQDKTAVEAFLMERGYRIAPVTFNNYEWVYATAYRRLLDDGGDPVALARLRKAYLVYMQAQLRYYERRSISLLGYNVPQIMTIHANELNAASFGELLAVFLDLGYRIIGLEEALRDPAYLRPDLYTGGLGLSWIQRWAIAEDRPRSFHSGGPEPAAWVVQLARTPAPAAAAE
jgi:peptidoglycan/xylan/chitin deacetylase (PgdA/CDA1 family)